MFETNPKAKIAEENQILTKNDEISSTASYANTKEPKIYVLGISRKQYGGFFSIISLTNIMLASSLLIMPMEYKVGGIFSSLIFSAIIALISFKTCSILIRHYRLEEIDISETIRRGLGNVWHAVFVISSFFYLFLLGMSMIYIAQNLIMGSIVPYVSNEINNQPASQNMQIIITSSLYGFLFLLVLINTQKILSYINSIGLLMVFVLIGFVLFFAIRTLSIRHPSVHGTDGFTVNLFSFKVSYVIGVFSLSFFVQTQAASILKYCKVPEKKNKYLAYSFGLTWILYAIIGTFGYIAIICPEEGSQDPDKYCYDNKKGTILMDFFYPNVLTLTMACLFFVQVISTIPTIVHVCRTHFFSLFWRERDPHIAFLILFDFFYIGIVYGISFLHIEPGIIQAFDGATCGFFLIYLIPIVLHLKILYKKRKTRTDSLKVPIKLEEGKLSNLNETSFDQGYDQDIELYDDYKISKYPRIILYSCLLFFGFCIFGANMYVVYQSIFQEFTTYLQSQQSSNQAL